MWLTTLDGMYSIADKAVERPDHLLVRARDEVSLINMRNRVVDFAKGARESVYVKTGPTDGVMCRGHFWTGKRLHGAGTDYEWRMEIPIDLFTNWFTLVTADLRYDNFKSECEHQWSQEFRHCNPSVVEERLHTLHRMWHIWNELWPKEYVFERPALRMVEGGVSNEPDTNGV